MHMQKHGVKGGGGHSIRKAQRCCKGRRLAIALGMHARMCVCMYACMYVCEYACVYAAQRRRMRRRLATALGMHACMCVCMYACVYVCVGVVEWEGNLRLL